MSVAKVCEELVRSSFVRRLSFIEDAETNEQRTTNNEQRTQIQVYTTLANGAADLPYPSGTIKKVDGVSVHYFKRLTKDHSHFSPALYQKLWKTAKDFDIIHIHAWWNLVSVIACLIALIKGSKIVFTPRGTLSSYSFNNRTSTPKKLFHTYIGKPLLKRCHIHTTSKREEIDIQTLLQPKYIKTIPNLVELPWPDAAALLTHHSPMNGCMKLIYLSRIEQKKGLELLFEILAAAEFHYHLEIAGTGEEAYLQELKALADDLQIAPHISWLGMLNKEEKFIRLAKNHLFVLPSYDENFANVVIESLFAGTPVWITENVGLSDYVSENQLGWVAKRDLTELAKLLHEAYLAIAQQTINRTYLQESVCRDFKEDNLISLYQQMYQDIIKNPTHRD